MSKDEGSATGDRVGVLEGNTEAVTFGGPPLLATRRLALGTAAAATAGFLADRALSPDSALAAEGVTSVNGKTGVVVLTADNVEAIPSVGIQAVATSNVATKGIPSKTLTDGVTLTEGQLVLLTAQTTASENGVWVVKVARRNGHALRLSPRNLNSIVCSFPCLVAPNMVKLCG